MAAHDGFLKWRRRDAPKRDAQERVGDFDEFVEARDPELRQQQAGRCMSCGVPFCQQGCPLGNPIPDFHAKVYAGRWREAWQLLSSTNNFPEVTGRICPAPCEAACVLAINDDAVTIEQIEKEIATRAFEQGWVQPQPAARRTGRTVAIVGSGPAGLAAAQQLARAGHDVTVFERDDRPGGLLRYGIPDFKFDRGLLDLRLAQLEAEGVRFRCGVDVGAAVSWEDLRADHDALLVAIGAGQPRDLQVPGRDLAGIQLAMDYLSAQNRRVAGQSVADPLGARGRDVVILGGGDTGSDCLGTALRQGARSVTQIELMPRPPDQRPPGNPWPQWPLLLRTSASHQEGGTRAFARMTTRLDGDDDGRIRQLHTVDVQLVDGRPQPLPGTERVLPCDLLLLAMGYLHPVTRGLVDALGVKLDARGNVQTDGFRTSVPGVYAAGDASRGASLVVWAISDGREAARAIDADLTGVVHLPTRGMDMSFGP